MNGYRQVKWKYKESKSKKPGAKKKPPTVLGETDLTLPGEELIGICPLHPADNDWENLFELNEADPETGKRTVKRPRLSETRYSQLYKLQDDRKEVAAVLFAAVAALPPKPEPEPEPEAGVEVPEGEDSGPLVPPQEGAAAAEGGDVEQGGESESGVADKIMTVDGHVQQGRFLIDEEADPESLIAAWLSENGKGPVADRAEAVAAISG